VTGIDDGCGLQSSISFDTVVGETYWLLLHGWESNNVGNYALNLSGSTSFGGNFMVHPPFPIPIASRLPLRFIVFRIHVIYVIYNIHYTQKGYQATFINK
jgi:hypothetical protein